MIIELSESKWLVINWIVWKRTVWSNDWCLIELFVIRSNILNDLAVCKRMHSANAANLSNNWVRKVIHWELCKKLTFDYLMIHAHTRICPGEWNACNSLKFWHTNKSSSPTQKSRSRIINSKKKENLLYGGAQIEKQR